MTTAYESIQKRSLRAWAQDGIGIWHTGEGIGVIGVSEIQTDCGQKLTVIVWSDHPPHQDVKCEKCMLNHKQAIATMDQNPTPEQKQEKQ